MIHQQEKLELLAQQKDIANDLMENKIMSREWIYNNIFDFNEQEKKDIFDGIVEDAKQKFRFEQIETEGNDPVDSGESVGTPADMEAMSDDSGFNMARRDEDWGGDRRSGTGEKEYGNEYDADDIKNATKKEKERYGKREFKGKSPLATSKGGTIVAREGLLNQLKNKFGNNIKDKSILSEENILKDEERSDKE